MLVPVLMYYYQCIGTERKVRTFPYEIFSLFGVCYTLWIMAVDVCSMGNACCMRTSANYEVTFKYWELTWLSSAEEVNYITVCMPSKLNSSGFYFLWDHWAHPGYFEKRILLKPALEVCVCVGGGGGGGCVCSLANYSDAYEETQSNRLSDFRDFVCSLFPKAILFYFYLTWRGYVYIWAEGVRGFVGVGLGGTVFPIRLHMRPVKTLIRLTSFLLCWYAEWSVLAGHTCSLVGNVVPRMVKAYLFVGC